MSDRQPADATEVEPASAPAASAEDRKAAAALSALDARGDDDADAGPTTADRRALDEAMSRLEKLDSGTKSGAAAAPGGEGGDSNNAAATRRKEEERRKRVKVDAADVALLVEHLELTKAKATELLKSHEGKLDKALTAYVTLLA